MRPYLEELIQLREEADQRVRAYVRPNDDTHLSLSDIEERGCDVPEGLRSLYEYLVDQIAEQLPTRLGSYPGLFDVPVIRLSSIVNPASQTTASRRLDESIRQEQTLEQTKLILESDVRRLAGDLEELGHPVGVTSAIAILALYSLMGIVAPVVVMAFRPAKLSDAEEVALIGAFVIGLFSVLAYILWYAKKLNDPIDMENS